MESIKEFKKYIENKYWVRFKNEKYLIKIYNEYQYYYNLIKEFAEKRRKEYRLPVYYRLCGRFLIKRIKDIIIKLYLYIEPEEKIKLFLNQFPIIENNRFNINNYKVVAHTRKLRSNIKNYIDISIKIGNNKDIIEKFNIDYRFDKGLKSLYDDEKLKKKREDLIKKYERSLKLFKNDEELYKFIKEELEYLKGE